MFLNIPGKVGLSRSITLEGHRLYWLSVSMSLTHIIAVSLISIANSLPPADDKSRANREDAAFPWTPFSWRFWRTLDSDFKLSSKVLISKVSESVNKPLMKSAASGGCKFKLRPKTLTLCFISLRISSVTVWWRRVLAWVGKFCEVYWRICRASSPWIEAISSAAWRPKSWNSHALSGAISSVFSRRLFLRRSRECVRSGNFSLERGF